MKVRRLRILVFGLFTRADWYFWEKHKLKHYDILGHSTLYLTSKSEPNAKSNVKWEITEYDGWDLVAKTEKLSYYYGIPCRATEMLFKTITKSFKSARS